MLKSFQYGFEELKITPSDLAEFMGFENHAPDPFPELIKKGLEQATEFCDIKAGFRLFDAIETNTLNKTIKINNQVFSPSTIVVSQLKTATKAVLFVCTAGSEISRHAQLISTNSDPMLGYIFDVIGSVAVDKAVDKMAEWLKKYMAAVDLGISDSYSPGYCEWSVSEQQKLFSLLPDKFCGVQLSASSLMYPIKSVSGIIGIGADLKQLGYQCNWCNDRNCFYGKIKRQKKKEK